MINHDDTTPNEPTPVGDVSADQPGNAGAARSVDTAATQLDCSAVPEHAATLIGVEQPRDVTTPGAAEVDVAAELGEIHLPELCLVTLIGVSGAGKTTFAQRAFAPTESVSSDFCRALVSGDANDQGASADAFDVLHYIAGKRLARGLLTVVDATNVTRAARADLVSLAKAHDVLPVAVVLDVGEKVAIERNAARSDRHFGAKVVKRHQQQLRQSMKRLRQEGFRQVHVLSSVAEVDAAVVVRKPLLNDRKEVCGPFDIIGDVHGCLDELVDLLGELGYQVVRDEQGRPVDAAHPQGRTVVFVGDLVDRGPSSVGVLRLAMGMEASGNAYAVPGNHEAKLVRALDGHTVKLAYGLETTMAELDDCTLEFRQQIRDWCYGLVSHLVFDGGKLVVAHAGLKEEYHGRASGRVRSFALYGDTTGETDEYGLPVRLPWAEDYRGKAMVVYGHVPTTRLEWVNNTICLDTGCVFGGELSALRYPERETVQVPARRTYYEAKKPLHAVPDSSSIRGDGELLLTDVLGRRVIDTEHMGRVTVSAENAAGALEVMSRFALPPSAIPYLPPTMSPPAASRKHGWLERPEEAFGQYAAWGVGQVMCQEKHMGSRAVVYVAPEGVVPGGGAVYTRTGRAFLRPEQMQEVVSRCRQAAADAGVLAELGTDWLLLDCEIMPWSLKAEGLLREQYAATGAAAQLAAPAAVAVLQQAAERGVDVAAQLVAAQHMVEDVEAYDAAWRRYVWPTDGLSGVRVAPFQVLAAQGATFERTDHEWHLAVADRLVVADPGLLATTQRLVVDTGDEASMAAGVAWWEALTEAGGEGMVVKPLGNCVRTRKGALVQPGIKVRGRDYLRIIYGPSYARPENLSRLKDRNVGKKRSMALREYALGLEAVARLVRAEPLWRVHEAVFAVLACESEPVDPRL